MLLEKLIAILLQFKGGALTLVVLTGTAVTITGTIGGEVVDLTVTPLAPPAASVPPSASPAPSPTLAPTASPSPAATAASLSLGNCGDEAAKRDAALEVLADVGGEAADLLRVAGTVALANGVERKAMRETLKESGHDIRDALKEGMHDVRDLAKRTLGDCNESSVEGLVSRLEHGLDEVAEVHEEFERSGSGNSGAVFVVNLSSSTAGLASPYRERVESALDDVKDLLDDLSAELQ